MTACHEVRKLRRSDGALRPYLLRDGMPLILPNLWIDELGAQARSFNSLDAYCRDLLIMYRWAEQWSVDLYGGFSSLIGLRSTDLKKLAKVLCCTAAGSFAAKATCDRRAQVARGFFDFAFSYFMETQSVSLEIQMQVEKNQRRQKALLMRYMATYRNKGADPGRSSSFSSEEMDLVWSVVHPKSELNPFRSDAIRVRNYCMLRVGMEILARRSEIVLLEVPDITFGSKATIKVKTPTINNATKRLDGASLKNKTSAREIPINHELAEALQYYLEEVRPRLVVARHPSPSFFLSARDGRRLANNTINQICDRLNQVPVIAAIGKRLHPHSLRTSGADRASLILTGSIEDPNERRELLAYWGGWRPNSSMPGYYTRGSVNLRLSRYIRGRGKKQ